ncbi:MAG: HDOD domain-containing protein [Gammaproteobacteria bacterium]
MTMYGTEKMDDYNPGLSSIRMEIQKIDYLPPMPAIAQEILTAANDKSSSLEDIAAIIKKDPGLAARVIGVANSAYFAYPRKIDTLEDAIINILGLDLVIGFALSIAMSGVFDPQKCPGFDINRYWCSALLTAELCKGMSVHVDSKQNLKGEQLHLYGLLHNIGVLVLSDRFPNIMSELFTHAARNKEKHLIEYEKETIDFNHHDAGGWLARKWHLPDTIIHIIQHLHETDYRGEDEYAVHLVGICSRIARQWLLETNYSPDQELKHLKTLGLDNRKIQKYLQKTRHKLDEIRQMVADMTGNRNGSN